MSKISIYFLFTGLFLFTYSCKSAEEKKAEELKLKVEQIHDNLMMKTEDLIKLRTELAKSSNQSGNMIQRSKVKVTIGLINAAESFMEDWMKFYGDNKPTLEDSIDDSIGFYEKQIKELERMEKQMDEALEKGKEWVEKLKK